MTKILDAGNNVVQKQQFLEENIQTTADGGILTLEELELSKLVNAEFFSAEIQIPNEYIVISVDTNGTQNKEAIWDHADPKFKDYDMVRVQVPNPDSGVPTVVVQHVTPFHIKRWPDRWKAYKQGRTIGADGVPIEQLSSIPVSAHMKLKELGIFTIEQLAKTSNAGNLMLGGNAFQAAARKFLANQQGSKADELEVELADMKAQLAELLAATKKATK